MVSNEEVKITPVPKSAASAHRQLYSKPEKMEIIQRTYHTPKGDEKIKYIRTKKYKNGVIKNEIIGISKNGKMIWGNKE